MTTGGDLHGVGDVGAENENEKCHLLIWGSSQSRLPVHKNDCTPSLIESIVNTPVCQFESQLYNCDDDDEDEQEKAFPLVLTSKGSVLKFYFSQLSLSPAPRSLIAEKVSQISCGTNHYAAVGVSGSLFTWGRGCSGQLGHGTADQEFVDTPKQVDALKEQTVVQVSCGSQFTVALTRDSAVYAWGSHNNGGTGHGIAATKQLLPRKINSLDGKSVDKVVAGDDHAAAKTTSGEMYTWGHGMCGQLGHGENDTNNHYVPKLVEAFRGKKIVQLSCGANFTAAATQTGLLYTFGENQSGQLGLGNTAWKPYPTLVKDLEGVSVLQVSCGARHAIALTRNDVYTWGDGANGQLGHGSICRSLVPQKVKELEGREIHAVGAFSGNTIALVKRANLLTEDVPLAESLRDMVNSEAGADLKFILEDGQVVFAHSCILCRRSDYFKSMLDSGMQESNKSPISIPGIREQVFLLLLEYIYAGSINIKNDEIVELYMLAGMHGLKKLKNICHESMEQALNAENAGKLLQSSASSGCEGLKKVCMDFVVKNAAAISESGSMKDISDVALCHKIIEKMAVSNGMRGSKRRRRK